MQLDVPQGVCVGSAAVRVDAYDDDLEREGSTCQDVHAVASISS